MAESQETPAREPMFLRLMRDFNALDVADYTKPTEAQDHSKAVVIGPAPDWLKRLWTLSDRCLTDLKDGEEKLKATSKEEEPEKYSRLLEDLRCSSNYYNFICQVMSRETAYTYQVPVHAGFFIDTDWTLGFYPQSVSFVLVDSGVLDLSAMQGVGPNSDKLH